MEAHSPSATSHDAESASPAPESTKPAFRIAGQAGVFLAEETTISDNGESDVVELGPLSGKLLSVVLGIQQSVEQQSLEVAVWGSTDGETWPAKPLLLLPQKFYAGVAEVLLNLEQEPEVRYVKAKWAANRWGRGATNPDFRAYVFLRPA